MSIRSHLATTAALGALLVGSFSGVPVSAQQRPPASPPAAWGPLSINLEEIVYPYPVSF